MQAFRKISGLALATLVVATLTMGCETGRTNKMHAVSDHINDVTTTGKPDPTLAANPEGQPPVPDSPTAAGDNGKQPFSDANGRPTLGVEKGRAAAPNWNHKDDFKRQ